MLAAPRALKWKRNRCATYSTSVQLAKAASTIISRAPASRSSSPAACHKKYNTTGLRKTSGTIGCTWVSASSALFSNKRRLYANTGHPGLHPFYRFSENVARHLSCTPAPQNRLVDRRRATHLRVRLPAVPELVASGEEYPSVPARARSRAELPMPASPVARTQTREHYRRRAGHAQSPRQCGQRGPGNESPHPPREIRFRERRCGEISLF